MARDSKDKLTLSLISEPKKLGRPSTGSALTPAQRKAQQRQRDRQLITNESLSNATTTALCEQLQHRVSMGDVDLVKGITLELMKRARLAMKNNVTVTKTSSLPGNKTKSVTVTKKPSPAIAKREAELKNMIAQVKPADVKNVTVTKKSISTGESMANQKAASRVAKPGKQPKPW